MPTVADLGRLVKAKHPGAYNDIADAELGRRVQAKYPGSYSDFSDSGSVPSMAMTAQDNPLARFGQSVGRGVLGLLPAAGGIVGSLPGVATGNPIMGIAGAGIGGDIGERARQYFSGEATSTPKAETAGLTQGGAQALGEGLGMAAGRMAGPLMRKALSASPALVRRFGTSQEAIAQTALRERLPMKQGPAQALADAIRTARGKVIAAQPGSTSARELASSAIRDSERALGRSLTMPEKAALTNKVQEEANAILAGRTHGIVPASNTGYTARELEQIKEVAAKNARPAYRAQAEMASTAASPALSRQIASGARGALNQIPGVKAQSSRLKSVMAVSQAIDRALAKSSGEWTPIHVGPLSVGLKLPREKMANLSLLLDSPKFHSLMRQSPRAAAALVSEMTQSDQPDATSR
jgi:hypothetical protein